MRGSQGFGIVELLIALVLFSFVAVWAYSAVTRSLRSTQENAETTRIQREIFRFVDRFQRDLENALSLGGSVASKQGSNAPGTCSAGRFYAGGLVPLPGYSKADVDAAPLDLEPITPSSLTPSSSASDAVRVVSLLPESKAVLVARDSGSGQPYPTSGTDVIVLSEAGDFQVGDYAQICDMVGCDLLRITHTGSGANGPEIEHSSTTSVWNVDFPRDFGMDTVGEVFVQKVRLSTYALDESSGIVYVNSHQLDDGFNPSTATFGGAAGLSSSLSRWTEAATHVTQLQVSYEYIASDNTKSWTRTPRVGPFNDTASEDCTNQTGYSTLSLLRIDVTWSVPGSAYRKKLSELVAPPNLINPFTGAAENLEGPEVILTPSQ